MSAAEDAPAMSRRLVSTPGRRDSRVSTRLACRFGVDFEPISRDPVADSPRNGHRVIAETLVIATDESGIHRLLDPVRPVLGEQDVEQLAKQRINLVIRDSQPATREGIL